MEISVYLKDYVEKLKKDKMKPFYNKKNNNFEIDNIYDYLKIIDILQNEKYSDTRGFDVKSNNLVGKP